MAGGGWRVAAAAGRDFVSQPLTALASQPISGFTMVEIAICLAIIGIALVSIIGVLPIGMNTQRDNREETIINQDAHRPAGSHPRRRARHGRPDQLRLCHHEFLDVV